MFVRSLKFVNQCYDYGYTSTRHNKICGYRDEMINHIIYECCRLKEYKTRYNCVGKVIHWELCKKFRFSHTNKWYMHNKESILENGMHKLLWDFQKQKDHLILARRPDLVIVNNNNKKKEITCRIVDFAVPIDHRAKLNESNKRDMHPNLARELKNYGRRRWHQL